MGTTRNSIEKDNRGYHAMQQDVVGAGRDQSPRASVANFAEKIHHIVNEPERNDVRK